MAAADHIIHISISMIFLSSYTRLTTPQLPAMSTMRAQAIEGMDNLNFVIKLALS